VVEGARRIDGEDRDGQGGDPLKQGRDLRQGYPQALFHRAKQSIN
jgi:hypothetical protein